MTVFTYRSHAHVILENFLCDYLFNGRRTGPGCEVASFYVDQYPGSDMSKACLLYTSDAADDDYTV